MEGMPASMDLQTKYQKLASEYSKIRAQATVLKKAVVDEQGKNSELKDLLKEKEQSLRKADQEMESINFRNQQLTKRVTVLQEELDLLQIKNKGKRKNSGNSSSVTENTEFVSQLIDEELEKKIQQNARLTSLLQEKEDDHARLTQQLMERVQSLEREVQQFQRASSDVEAKYKAQLDNLQSEKLRLGECVSERERDVQQYSAQVAALQLQQDRLQTELGQKLRVASDIIATRLPFVDSKKYDLNELNVPSHNRKQQTWSLQLVSQVGGLICDLTSQLSDFHTYTEQRLHALTDTLTPLATKFSVHLRENARYLRALEQGYKEFQAGLDAGVLISLETVPSLQHVADRLDKYSAYLQKLLPYQLFSLEEENALSTCSDEMKKKNSILADKTLAFTNCFMKLSNYVNLLALQSKRRKQHPQVCQKRFLEEIVHAVKDLHACVSNLADLCKEKSSVENSLSERVHSTNDCLVNSIVALVATTKELHEVLHTNKDKMLQTRKSKGTSTPVKSHPAVADFKSRASSYLQGLEESEPPSVPYEVALQQQEEAAGGVGSREALGVQLHSAEQRATQLEQDREHWRHEFQLLNMRHIKEQQRSRELEEQLALSRSSATTPQSENSGEGKPTEVLASSSPAPSQHSDTQPPPGSPAVVTGLLGQVLCPVQMGPEAEAREEEVKRFFTERVNQLVAERQLAEGKAIAFKAECTSLHERLQLATEQRSVAEQRMASAENALGRLQEELHTTTTNYESQLSMMSEHLANMNEKLTAQKDEIDQLKYQLGLKVQKKGKK